MKDVTTSQRLTRRRIVARVRRWRTRLLLERWTVGVEVGPDLEEESEASCIARPEYLTMTLRFDPAKIEPGELDAYVIHELLHAYIWPLANLAERMAGDDPAKQEAVRVEEETLATALERVVVALTRGRTT